MFIQRDTKYTKNELHSHTSVYFQELIALIKSMPYDKISQFLKLKDGYAGNQQWFRKNIVLNTGWLVVWVFNATITAMVISWRLVTHMCFLTFSHQY